MRSATFYASPLAVPPEVEPSLAGIVSAALRPVGGGEAVSRLLDVGTGTGALVPYFLAEGVPGEGILAIDVAPRMLEHARGRFPDVAFVEADFLGPDLNGLIFDVVVMNGEAVSLRQFSPPDTVTCNFGA